MYSTSSLLEKFQNAKQIGKPLVLDGAVGSLLQQSGFKIIDFIWATKINETNPESIIELHKEYIGAGADIISTNTFRTNPVALTEAGIFNFREQVELAVNHAKTAVYNKQILIAGSNPPAEDCYQKTRKITKKKLELNHSKHIDLLIENGVDFILNETQSHFDEIEFICKYCSKNSLPFVVSIYSPNVQEILAGEDLLFVLKYIWDHGAAATA